MSRCPSILVSLVSNYVVEKFVCFLMCNQLREIDVQLIEKPLCNLLSEIDVQSIEIYRCAISLVKLMCN